MPTKLLIGLAMAVIIFGVLYFFYDYRSASPLQVEPAGLSGETAGSEDKASSKQESSTFRIETIRAGEGRSTEAGDRLTVHYTGRLADGTTFDSSLDRGQPFVFTLGAGQVIRGWDQGLVGMKAGEKRRLTIPPELGYGPSGTPGGPIPPNATLVFEVELLKIN